MFILYFILWVMFNGNITLEICIFGLLIAAGIFAFSCKFMDYSLEKEWKIYRNIWKGIRYIVLLVMEVVKANFAVIRLVLSQKEEIEPELVTFKADLKTPVGKTLLANSITLTPGTITVSLEEDTYIVHCLDDSLAEGLDATEFAKRIKEME